MSLIKIDYSGYINKILNMKNTRINVNDTLDNLYQHDSTQQLIQEEQRDMSRSHISE